MKAKPYPKYKPSGVEWLGEVPEHWGTKKVTYGFLQIGSGTTPKSDGEEFYGGNVPWVTTSELRETVITKTKQTVTEHARKVYSALRLYPVGTLLFAMYGATIGRLGILGTPATLNQACCAFAQPTLFHPKFVFYWLWMRRPILISLSTGGGQPNLSQDDLRQIRISIPGISEQQAIAAFLDRETARIDLLIEKKQKLIERLQEKRVALISRTVTRGIPFGASRSAASLDDRSLKTSGIEYIKEVPTGWRVTKVWLERVARNIEYQDGNHGELHPKAEDYVSDGIPFVMANHLVNGQVDFANCNYIERALAASLRIGFAQTEDVLLTHKGTIGRVGMVQQNRFPYVMLTPQVTYYRCLRSIIPRYLFWFFQGSFWQDQMYLVSSLGTTRGYIGLLDQRSLYVLLPSVSEQKTIAAYLDQETVKLDEMLSKVEAAIERLQEYRTSLITSAVTGKIDVRKAAA